MITTQFSQFFVRDLEKFRNEIEAYENESQLWLTPEGISNSAGTLCLHLIGNMNHFIGFAIGKTGYIRQRDLEFSSRNVPRAELIHSLNETIQMVQQSMLKLNDNKLNNPFPLDKHGEQVTHLYMLTHLLTHLNYHLGQVNYHRRLTKS